MQATTQLKTEHDLIERALNLLEQTAERIRSERRVPDGFTAWLMDFLRNFVDRRHHGKEEDLLFPLLEERGVPREGGPIGVMLSEHTLGRDCVHRMKAAIADSPVDLKGFDEPAAQYVALLRQHIAKENGVLFPMAQGWLSAEDDDRLVADFAQADREFGDEQLLERYQQDVKQWERTFSLTDLTEDATYQAVLASYYRCEDSGGFFDTFYDLFFAKSPEIAPKFASTDMEMQKQIVMASVLMMLRLRTGDQIARQNVERIGETHSHIGHNIRPDLYEHWLDALCESVFKHDPEFSQELDGMWREIMSEGVELIASKY